MFPYEAITGQLLRMRIVVELGIAYSRKGADQSNFIGRFSYEIFLHNLGLTKGSKIIDR